SARCPGHVVGACGHASQVARWGSHSAGQRTGMKSSGESAPAETGADVFSEATFSTSLAFGSLRAGSAGLLIPDALRDLGVRVDPAVAQERPVAAHRLDRAEIAVDQQVLLAVRRRARDHAPERIGDERLAPEADAVLAPDAVHRRDEHAVRDRVTALHRL